ncbi:hypothetical protein SAMN04489730_8439 [Amycolatopsis australiensis]|uniref:Uncharacterized protein n=1 Tax=Amycolatopsis australiensis TaxID=546364 RepID=A0A1K1T6J9_9PSEU|nr:hypothetical protein SAMN04489730_8439 [Amycolatopsis australiensis]
MCRFLVGLFPLVIALRWVDYPFGGRSGRLAEVFADREIVIYSPADNGW